MKKYIISLIIVFCAMSAFAGQKTTLLFNRPQFQLRRADASYDGKPALTVPLVYAGDLRLNDVYAEDDSLEDGCFVQTSMATYPMYMTMCQPCLDCYPCTQLGVQDGVQLIDGAATGENASPMAITRWNLYILDLDKKAKKLDIYKLPIASSDPVFFTGNSSSNGQAFAQYVEPTAGFAMAGKKNDYKFKYLDATLGADYSWKVNGNGTSTAYIKSVTKWEGLCINWLAFNDYGDTDPLFYGYHSAGVIKLTRNASLTNTMVKNAFSSVVHTTSNNWEDCSLDTPASYCEALFTSEVGDKMDEYLYNMNYKRYSVNFVNTKLDSILSEMLAN